MYRAKSFFKQRKHFFGGVFIAIIAGFMAAEQVAAHKVTVFAWVDGEMVHTQSKFSGGRVAKQARIEVYNTAGERLLEGRTDHQGRFVFKTPQKEDLQIVLVAGSGHRNEWLVRAEEFGGNLPAAITEKSIQPNVTSAVDTPPEGDDLHLSRADLEEIIASALDRKLQPLTHRLNQLGDRPKLPDIIGGIGYILGLVGLGAYIHFRRQSKPEDRRAR